MGAAWVKKNAFDGWPTPTARRAVTPFDPHVFYYALHVFF